ncbi:hypothetical protein ACOQNP_12300 [Ectopseudomonas khazarica]|uniref:hypothetical protein n=1 Tax=Ectopseudomonas khazarica TaxID=2502979 RepID=UPI00055D3345
MSEQESTYNDAPEDGKDWFLQNLITLAEGGWGLPVTLTTTGGTVSGRVISGGKYIARIEAKLRNAVPDGGTNEHIEELANWAKKLSPVFNAYDVGGAYFIHLEDVRVDIAGQVVTTKQVWRGNLAHVTGFILGELNP